MTRRPSERPVAPVISGDSRPEARPTLVGAAVAVGATVVGVVLALIAGAIGDVGRVGKGTVITLAVLAGFVAGGYVAGRSSRLPFTNGATAAALASVPLAVVRIAQRVSDHRSIPGVQILFALLLAASLGVFGAALAARAKR